MVGVGSPDESVVGDAEFVESELELCRQLVDELSRRHALALRGALDLFPVFICASKEKNLAFAGPVPPGEDVSRQYGIDGTDMGQVIRVEYRRGYENGRSSR